MKTIREFYNEVANSAELQKEFADALSRGRDAVIAFARAHDCDATEEEAVAFFQANSGTSELTDEELDAVAGGKLDKFTMISICTLGAGCALVSIIGAALQMGCKDIT